MFISPYGAVKVIVHPKRKPKLITKVEKKANVNNGSKDKKEWSA